MRRRRRTMGVVMTMAAVAGAAGCVGDPMGVAMNHVLDSGGGAGSAARGGFVPADTVIVAQSLRDAVAPGAVGKDAAGRAVGAAPR